MLRTALHAFRPSWPRRSSSQDPPIQTVTVAGITGALGPAIISALLEADFKVQALTRDAESARAALATAQQQSTGSRISNSMIGGGPRSSNSVTFRSTDYRDHAGLVELLRGQDAIVSCLGDTAAAVAAQRALIEAAIEAGVRRFLPSEFGSDTTHPRIRENPFFRAKIEHQNLLKTLSEQHPFFSYSTLITGPFLDWGLSVVPFIIDVGNMSAQLYDNGSIPFSITRTATVGRAVAATLQRASRTRNRVLFVHEAVVTQNELIAEALVAAAASHSDDYHRSEEALFTTHPISTTALERAAWTAYRRYQQRDPPPDPLTWILPFINLSIWAGDHRGRFSRVDNALLGLPAPLQRRAKREMIAREVRRAREGFVGADAAEVRQGGAVDEEKEKIVVEEVELVPQGHQEKGCVTTATMTAASKAYQGGLQRLIGVVASSS